jgi:hypothetical protein
MVLMLARLCLVALGVGSALGPGATARQPEGSIRRSADRPGGPEPGKEGTADVPVRKGGLSIVIYCDRGDPALRKVMEGLRRIDANDPMLGEPEKGQGISANVVVKPGTPSKQVAAAIAVLLDAGINTITVKVRK